MDKKTYGESLAKSVTERCKFFPKMKKFFKNEDLIECPICGSKGVEKSIETLQGGEYAVIRCKSCKEIIETHRVKPDRIHFTREFAEGCTKEEFTAFCKSNKDLNGFTNEEINLMIEIYNTQSVGGFMLPCLTVIEKDTGIRLQLPFTMEKLTVSCR